MRKSSLILIQILMIAQMMSAQSELLRVNRQRHFSGILPGNYSGIAHIRGDEYAVVSDKSFSNGFFVFKIAVDSITGDILSVRDNGFHCNDMSGGDLEGIAYNPVTNTVFISGEADNSVAEYTLQGDTTGRQMAVPDVFRHATGNAGLESLSYNVHTGLYWTMNESTLICDGLQATSVNRLRNRLRLQSFGEDLLPRNQYAYLMDEPVADKTARNYAMGVSEVLALDNGRLLVLERELYVPKQKIGAFVNCKIYEVNPSEAQPISISEPLTASSPYMDKHLIYSWRTNITLLDHSFANCEGMCLGPFLKDGSRVVILISDSQNGYGGILKDWFKTIVIK
ncbi:esterase-like activity of phytase family protein [Xylanibacter caecicola]|uniref:esterase-like activity of phytase family protein n=1 Tax=Xylanibacter caecicola TaxID=2736294 RepID=UPI00258BF6EC|nr:esterase-like activity of phytase family protein [Xylanibacter caecicola]